MWKWLAGRWEEYCKRRHSGMNGASNGRQLSILARAYSFHTHQSHEEGSHSQLEKQKARPTRETVCEGACSVPDTSP